MKRPRCFIAFQHAQTCPHHGLAQPPLDHPSSGVIVPPISTFAPKCRGFVAQAWFRYQSGNWPQRNNRAEPFHARFRQIFSPLKFASVQSLVPSHITQDRHQSPRSSRHVLVMQPEPRALLSDSVLQREVGVIQMGAHPCADQIKVAIK